MGRRGCSLSCGSGSTVYSMAQRGDLPHIRLGSRYRFRVSEVIDAMRPERPVADTSRPVPRRRAQRLADYERGLENMRAATAYIDRIDPHGRMTQDESVEALRRGGFLG
ncbi:MULTISPECIES: helix-turn-helix domain-containing protein [unclassified Microbacterium]